MEELKPQSIRILLTDLSRVAEARRAAAAVAQEHGLKEDQAGRLAIIVTELAGNVVKHARNGEMYLRVVRTNAAASIEVLAIDRGPGMADFESCLRDGYSTAGTPGTGLGAVVRLADDFDAWSTEKLGTVIMARVRSTASAPAPFHVAEFASAMRGETLCGDSTATAETPDGFAVVVADGLGHGPDAARASRTAIRIFEQNPGRVPAEQIQAMHLAMHATRGAAIAVARIRPREGQVTFCGVGNISARINGISNVQMLVSHNGTAGHNVRRVQEFVYPWSGSELLILHSDGINTHWKLDAWPGLSSHDPALIASVIYREESRGRDDVSAVVIRERNAA